MAPVLHLLVIVGVCVAAGRACPSKCTCGPYQQRPNEIYVDCSSQGLQVIPQNLPANTKALNMQNNLLTAIDKSALPSSGLRELNLNNNKISEIPQESIKMDGDCNIEEFPLIKGNVRFGRWEIKDLTSIPWPCLVDLRNNPITQIRTRAFAGSQRFSVFLGHSPLDLTIEALAFDGTSGLIGLHISDVPTLKFEYGSFDNMGNIGWMVFDKTKMMLSKLYESTRPRWIRISNSKILGITAGTLGLKMDVEYKCDANAYEYGPARVLTSHVSTIKKGGIELINNTLPDLPRYLIRGAIFGGIYFHGNKIPMIEKRAFARASDEAEICAIRFANNKIDTNKISAGVFSELRNVVRLDIFPSNVMAIEGGAFANNNYIKFLGVTIENNNLIDEFTIEKNAFAGIQGVQIFRLRRQNENDMKKPKLLIEPYAFDGFRDVSYVSVYLFGNMPELPNYLFTGLKVKENFNLEVKNVVKIGQRAFGTEKARTDISRFEFTNAMSLECDCETSALLANMEQTVGTIEGFSCTGTVYNSSRLEECAVVEESVTEDDSVTDGAAFSLPTGLVWVALISSLFMMYLTKSG